MREIVYEGQARRDEPSVARNSESDSWLKQRGARQFVRVPSRWRLCTSSQPGAFLFGELKEADDD